MTVRTLQWALAVVLFQLALALADDASSEQSGEETNPHYLRRQLPGNDYFDVSSLGGMGGTMLFVILGILVLCCLCGGRLSICDMLACVCIYEMCCDDGRIGGFNLL